MGKPLKAKFWLFMGCLGWLFIYLAVPLTAFQSQESELNEFIGRIHVALEAKDFDAYIQFYDLPLRDRELAKMERKVQDFQMEDITITRVFTQSTRDGGVQIVVRVFFENPHTVFLENWRLLLKKTNGAWSIVSRQSLGDFVRMYKIHIPGGEWQRVQRIEVRHADITLTFQNALVFYDSLPEMQTALLILGKGHVCFSPSPYREKHQLELMFKHREFNETLEYAYLRFSPVFFAKNITIVSDPDKQAEPPDSVKNQAYSLFAKHYPRSFAVEHPGNTRYLSTLPNGDEAVFDFKSRRHGLFTYIFSPFAEEEVHLFQWERGRLVSMYSPSEDDPSQKRLFVSSGRSFDVLHYTLGVDFNPREYFFSGKARIRIKAKMGSQERLRLKFNSQLHILSVQGENREELYYSQDKLRDNLYVYFLEPPEEGDELTFEIHYEGRLETRPQPEEGLLIGQTGDPAAPRLSQFGTYLYTRQDYWYPAPPHDDYFHANMTVKLPLDQTVVATGTLIGTRKETDVGAQPAGERRVYDFKTQRPVKYLAFISGNFTKIAGEDEPFPVKLYRDRNFESSRWDVFEEAKRIHQFYISLFGPYPYEKLSVVQRLWSQAGGNSPPSFIVLNELPRASRRGGLVPALSPIDLRRWDEFFLAHEIAHQWWGQGISWDTYHDLWMSEGIAQFAAISYLRFKYGERAYAMILKKFSKWTERNSHWGPITLGTRLSHMNFDAFQTIIYNKTALVLNMLQSMLGEGKFRDSLKSFYEKHQYETVRSAALFREFQEKADQDLSSFFNSWFDSHLLPDIGVTRSIRKTENGFRMEVFVDQRMDVFVFPLVLEWNEGGRRVSMTVTVKEKKQSFVFSCGEKPRAFKVNPEGAVPGKFN